MTQLGFADLLTEAATTNEQRQMDRATAHLPGTMEEALPFYRCMIDKHHAAMQAAAIEQAMSIREEAHLLAAKLNGGTCGIIAGPDAPGCILEHEISRAAGLRSPVGTGGRVHYHRWRHARQDRTERHVRNRQHLLPVPRLLRPCRRSGPPLFERNRIPLLPWRVRPARPRPHNRGLRPRDDCRACQAGTERKAVTDRDAPEGLRSSPRPTGCALSGAAGRRPRIFLRPRAKLCRRPPPFPGAAPRRSSGLFLVHLLGASPRQCDPARPVSPAIAADTIHSLRTWLQAHEALAMQRRVKERRG